MKRLETGRYMRLPPERTAPLCLSTALRQVPVAGGTKWPVAALYDMGMDEERRNGTYRG